MKIDAEIQSRLDHLANPFSIKQASAKLIEMAHS